VLGRLFLVLWSLCLYNCVERIRIANPTALSDVICQHILFLYLQQTTILLRTSVDLRHPPPPQPRAFDCTVYLVHYLAASGENGAACQAVPSQGRQAKRGKNGINHDLSTEIQNFLFIFCDVCIILSI
jgi:hypothetical protein